MAVRSSCRVGSGGCLPALGAPASRVGCVREQAPMRALFVLLVRSDVSVKFRPASASPRRHCKKSGSRTVPRALCTSTRVEGAKLVRHLQYEADRSPQRQNQIVLRTFYETREPTTRHSFVTWQVTSLIFLQWGHTWSIAHGMRCGMNCTAIATYMVRAAGAHDTPHPPHDWHSHCHWVMRCRCRVSARRGARYTDHGGWRVGCTVGGGTGVW